MYKPNEPNPNRMEYKDIDLGELNDRICDVQEGIDYFTMLKDKYGNALLDYDPSDSSRTILKRSGTETVVEASERYNLELSAMTMYSDWLDNINKEERVKIEVMIAKLQAKLEALG
jgi:hypothetical protein